MRENARTEESSSEMDESPTVKSADPEAIRLMNEVDNWLSHVWMVRTFLKHSDEATDDEELAEVHRGLYDYMLALGPSFEAGDANRYLKIAKKKLSKLKATATAFRELQPEVSGHMNFRMANKSLSLAVEQIQHLIGES